MSKAVLISIKPYWCSLIATGNKTVEVRKSIPRLDAPFKCYIYCTKAPKGWFFMHAPDVRRDGKVIGEFLCDRIHEYEAEFHEDNGTYQDIREIFRSEDDADDDCRDFHIITSNEEHKPDNCKLCWESCLTFNELKRYMGGECFCSTFFGWHISDLKIYDRPRELSEFRVPCAEYERDNPRCGSCRYYYSESNEAIGFYDECRCDGLKHLERPPQSWCYVEEREDNG